MTVLFLLLEAWLCGSVAAAVDEATTPADWRKKLAAPEPSLRKDAVTAGAAAGDWQALLPLLQDRDAEVRLHLLLVMAKAGTACPQAAQHLRSLAKDPDANVRAAVLAGLGLLNDTHEETLKMAGAALDDAAPLVRQAAILTLANHGAAARPYLPRLLQFLKSDSAEEVSAVCFTLGQLRQDSAAVTAAVEPLLNGENSAGKVEANALLWKLGGGKAHLQALETASRDRDPRVRDLARDRLAEVLRAYVRLHPGESLSLLKDLTLTSKKTLVTAMHDLELDQLRPLQAELLALLDDGSLRDAAYPLLRKFGKELVPALREQLKDGSVIRRREAAVVLGQIGAPALPALAELVTALKDRDYSVRQAAALALGQFGAGGKPALSALKAAEKDEHPLVKHKAATAIALIEGREPPPEPENLPVRKR